MRLPAAFSQQLPPSGHDAPTPSSGALTAVRISVAHHAPAEAGLHLGNFAELMGVHEHGHAEVVVELDHGLAQLSDSHRVQA